MKKLIGWLLEALAGIGALIALTLPAMGMKVTVLGASSSENLKMSEFLKAPEEGLKTISDKLFTSYNMVRFTQIALIVLASLLLIVVLIGLLKHFKILKLKMSAKSLGMLLTLLLVIVAAVSLVGNIMYVNETKKLASVGQIMTYSLGLSTIVTLACGVLGLVGNGLLIKEK